MQEMGTALTLTGLIATIIAIAFAGAALYISHHHKDRQESGSNVKNNKNKEDNESNDNAQYQQNSISSDKPLFNKLGSGGVEEANINRTNKDEYIWE
jgi:flagellar biosynthesis component FlhA